MDDRTKRGPADRRRISLSEDYERRYWTHRLGCSAEQLEAAVAAVGREVKDVERYLTAG